MDPLEVGQALRRRRHAAGMTQAEVARAMRSTQPSVSRAESGLVMPSVGFLERYAWATGRMLPIDLGPPALVRGSAAESGERPAAVVDPRAEALARIRELRRLADRGEISSHEFALQALELEMAAIAQERAQI